MLRALPATQQFFSSADPIANSPCSLFINDRIPSNENPSANIIRLTPAEIRFRFPDIACYKSREFVRFSDSRIHTYITHAKRALNGSNPHCRSGSARLNEFPYLRVLSLDGSLNGPSHRLR